MKKQPPPSLPIQQLQATILDRGYLTDPDRIALLNLLQDTPSVTPALLATYIIKHLNTIPDPPDEYYKPLNPAKLAKKTLLTRMRTKMKRKGRYS